MLFENSNHKIYKEMRINPTSPTVFNSETVTKH